MTDDIVARLRDADGGYGFRAIVREAADEIERLREELTASHESHGNEVGALTERLSLAIHERDEARRDRCMARAVIRWDIEHPNSPQRSQTTIILLAWQIADEEGWDCFNGRKR
jgi:hypothetical protein